MYSLTTFFERKRAMKNFSVVIPALNPTNKLIFYVDELLKENIPQIIIVNDGSKKECEPIFSQLRNKERCIVLQHKVNRGKGQALKTAFQYVLKNGGNQNIVTADCDGQHSVEDVLKVGNVLENFKGIVLGVRNFKEKHVPFRSFLGNTLTIIIFNLFFHCKLKDTQTGLRGIPFEMLTTISNLLGDRYEYEMNVLIYVARNNIPIKEVPIQTLYFNNNSNSYYQPLKDSLKIFSTIISSFRTSNEQR